MFGNLQFQHFRGGAYLWTPYAGLPLRACENSVLLRTLIRYQEDTDQETAAPWRLHKSVMSKGEYVCEEIQGGFISSYEGGPSNKIAFKGEISYTLITVVSRR